MATKGSLALYAMLCLTAGFASASSGQGHNSPGGCEDARWTYVNDTEKQATAAGKLTYIDTSTTDGDLHLNMSLDASSAGLQAGFRDPNDDLTIELGLGLNPFSRLVTTQIDLDMNVVVKGDWVIDEHDYDITQKQWWLHEDPEHWAELHPIRYLRGSVEKNPLIAHDFVFLFAQDWNLCRLFFASQISNSETLSLPLQSREQAKLPFSGSGVGPVGFVHEESVLDGYRSDSPHSAYETKIVGLPENPELQVIVTLPALYYGRHPGYLAHFSRGTTQALYRAVTSEFLPLTSGKKALHMRVVSKLVGWPNAQPPLRATWTFTTGSDNPRVTEWVSNPLNREFTIDGTYSPSEQKNDTEWSLGVVVSDKLITDVPSAASDGWIWSRTIVDDEVRYFVTPSYISVTQAGANAGGLPHTDVDIVLHASEHLIPQVSLTGPLHWRIVPPLGSHKGNRLQLRGGNRLTVSPTDDHVAVLASAAGDIVEVTAETDLGEKLLTQIEVNPITSGNLNTDQPGYQWVDYWLGGLALQRLSHIGGSTNPTAGAVSPRAIGNRDLALERRAWGSLLQGGQLAERDAFLSFVRGDAMTADDKAAIKRVGERGRSLRTSSKTFAARFAPLIGQLIVRPLRIEANGRPVLIDR